MISYEELAAALERYAARQRGEAPPEPEPHAAAAPTTAADIYSPPPDYYDSPATGEHDVSPRPVEHAALGGDEESTQVGELPADHSQELDIGDVISDDEVH